MTNELAAAPGNVQVLHPEPPRLSDSLTRAIADSLNLVPTCDGGLAWSPPASLGPEDINEARMKTPSYAAALEPASNAQKLRWFLQLARLVSGATSFDEGMDRIKAMIPDLGHPALCFTDETRREAGRRFKYLPAFAEISEYFDEIVRPHRERVRRLERIAALSPYPHRREITIAERQLVGEMWGVLGKKLRGELSREECDAELARLRSDKSRYRTG